MTSRDGWVPDRLWLRVPIEAENLPGADEWLRRQVTHIAAESGGRLLIGPPLRKEDPQGFMYDTVLYVYPAERHESWD